MSVNQLFSYTAGDFILQDQFELLEKGHQLAVIRDLEKLVRYPFRSIISCQTSFVDTFCRAQDGKQIYKVKPHAQSKTQYRLPVVSLEYSRFTILGMYNRKDAKHQKEILIAIRRYEALLTNPLLSIEIDLDVLKEIYVQQ